MTHIVNAVLVRRAVSQQCPDCGDPLMVIRDDIELGKVYRVDLDTRAVRKVDRTHRGVVWEGEVVTDLDHGALLPTELLSWKGQE